MTRNRILLTGAACLALAAPFTLAACGDSGTEPPSQSPAEGQTTPTTAIDVAATYTEKDTTIAAQVNTPFAVKLASNPSTGYAWRLGKSTGPANVSVVTTRFEKGAAAADGRVGVGGMDIWTLVASGPGAGVITFGLVPPGRNAKPERTVTFTVTATTDGQSGSGDAPAADRVTTATGGGGTQSTITGDPAYTEQP